MSSKHQGTKEQLQKQLQEYEAQAAQHFTPPPGAEAAPGAPGNHLPPWLSGLISILRILIDNFPLDKPGA